MTIILRDILPEDLSLAIRAVEWLMIRDHHDTIISYGEKPATKDFYVRRNKSSISVRRV